MTTSYMHTTHIFLHSRPQSQYSQWFFIILCRIFFPRRIEQIRYKVTGFRKADSKHGFLNCETAPLKGLEEFEGSSFSICLFYFHEILRSTLMRFTSAAYRQRLKLALGSIISHSVADPIRATNSAGWHIIINKFARTQFDAHARYFGGDHFIVVTEWSWFLFVNWTSRFPCPFHALKLSSGRIDLIGLEHRAKVNCAQPLWDIESSEKGSRSDFRSNCKEKKKGRGFFSWDSSWIKRREVHWHCGED